MIVDPAEIVARHGHEGDAVPNIGAGFDGRIDQRRVKDRISEREPPAVAIDPSGRGAAVGQPRLCAPQPAPVTTNSC